VGVDIDDITKRREKLEVEVDGCEKEVKKLDTTFGKYMMEWKTVYNGLIEGKQVMAEDEERLKKEMEKHLKGLEATWNKMLQKLQTIKDSIADVAKVAATVMGDLDKAVKELEKMATDTKKAAGDIKEIQAESAAIKKLTRTAERLWTEFNRIKQDSSSVAPDPKL
jgi:DNA repair exonuclease SbcCD ATPase subunit